MALLDQHAAATVAPPLPQTPPLPEAQRIARPAKTTAASLGIRSVEVPHERLDVRGDVLGGPNMVTLLAGGDADFSAWWRADFRRAARPFQCRSPDGCTANRLDGHSYCPRHTARYIASRMALAPPPRTQRRRPLRRRPLRELL